MPVVVVGTKMDLITDIDLLQQYEGEAREWCSRFQYPYFSARHAHSVSFFGHLLIAFSAITGANVNEVFERLARLVYARASFSYPTRVAQVQKSSRCFCT